MDDILTDNWFVQYFLEKGEVKGEAKGRAEGLEAFQQTVLDFIQAHFPEMTQQAQKVVRQVTDFQQLQGLILNISFARDAAEVAQLLSALSTKAD